MIYEQLKSMQETHCCTQCGAPLCLIWDGDADNYTLVCGTDRTHQGYKARESSDEQLRRGELDTRLGPGAQKDLEKSIAQAGHWLSRLPKKDLGDNKIISQQQVLALVRYADALGLHAFLGHVCIYYGQPYITIDGYYYKLRKDDHHIRVGTRPLTADERIAYQVLDTDYAWIAEAWEGGEKLPTTGLGIVPKEEIEGKSDKNPEHFRAPIARSHPQRMAEKRAEWQLLRKILPLDEKERQQ